LAAQSSRPARSVPPSGYRPTSPWALVHFDPVGAQKPLGIASIRSRVSLTAQLFDPRIIVFGPAATGGRSDRQHRNFLIIDGCAGVCGTSMPVRSGETLPADSSHCSPPSVVHSHRSVAAIRPMWEQACPASWFNPMPGNQHYPTPAKSNAHRTGNGQPYAIARGHRHAGLAVRLTVRVITTAPSSVSSMVISAAKARNMRLRYVARASLRSRQSCWGVQARQHHGRF